MFRFRSDAAHTGCYNIVDDAFPTRPWRRRLLR